MISLPVRKYRERAHLVVTAVTLALYNSLFTSAEIHGITSDVVRLMRRNRRSVRVAPEGVTTWIMYLAKDVAREWAKRILAEDPGRWDGPLLPPGMYERKSEYSGIIK